MERQYFCPKCGKKLEEENVLGGICPHCRSLFDKPLIKNISQKGPEKVKKSAYTLDQLIPSSVKVKFRAIITYIFQKVKFRVKESAYTLKETIPNKEKEVKMENNKENPDGLLSVISLLIPLFGLIAGAIFITRPNEIDRKTGVCCLSWALVGIVLYIVIHWFIISPYMQNNPFPEPSTGLLEIPGLPSSPPEW